MILKQRKIPIIILKLEALLRRLPQNHPKYTIIKEQLLMNLSGFNGEKAIDYHLSFLPEHYKILHDIRLKTGPHFFQIDTLIFSSKFAVLLEVKNIAGTLYFDQKFHQLLRMLDGEETAFQDPLLQVQRQEGHFQKWLQANKLTSIPLHSFVVISKPSTIIKTSPENKSLHRYVFHSELLPLKITELEKTTISEIAPEHELKKITRKILKHHTPLETSVLAKYKISEDDLMQGVFCPYCETVRISRANGKWYCARCDKYSKDAHTQAIRDYFFLFGNIITNQKLRHFLQIESPSLATRILQSLELNSIGSKKGKYYILDYTDL